MQALTIEELYTLLKDPINGSKYTLAESDHFQVPNVFLHAPSNIIYCRNIYYCIFYVYGLSPEIVNSAANFAINGLNQSIDIAYQEIKIKYKLEDNVELFINTYSYGS